MEWIAMVLISLGVLLLVAEIFIPSFGITGTLGIIFIVLGVVTTAETLVGGILIFTIIIGIAIILMFIAYKIVASKGSPFVLSENLKEEVAENLDYFKGKQGVALTPLRPAGTGDFSGVRLDVLTKGEFIEKGMDIIVDEVSGKRIFVKKI